MAFDKCTLLSSQGSDAPPTTPHGIPEGQLLYLTLRVSLVKSAFPTEVRRDDSLVTKLDRLLSVSASRQPAGQLHYLIPLADCVKSAVRDDLASATALNDRLR